MTTSLNPTLEKKIIQTLGANASFDITPHVQDGHIKLNYALAEKLFHYMIGQQQDPQSKAGDNLPMGVRCLMPKKGSHGNEKPLVVNVGIHTGEAPAGLAGLLPLIAAAERGELKQPVYMVLDFPENLEYFFTLLKKNDCFDFKESQKDKVDALVRKVRPIGQADPNRLKRNAVQKILSTNDYVPSSALNRRMAQLMPIFSRGHTVLDIHTATAPFSENIKGGLPKVADPCTINPHTDLEKCAPLLKNSPIRTVVPSLLAVYGTKTVSTLKGLIGEHFTTENVLGIEAGFHHPGASFATSANFVGQLASNLGVVPQNFCGIQPIDDGKFLSLKASKQIFAPGINEGKDWYITDEMAEKLARHGASYQKGEVLAISGTGEKLVMGEDGTIVFPGHENFVPSNKTQKEIDGKIISGYRVADKGRIGTIAEINLLTLDVNKGADIAR